MPLHLKTTFRIKFLGDRSLFHTFGKGILFQYTIIDFLSIEVLKKDEPHLGTNYFGHSDQTFPTGGPSW